MANPLAIEKAPDNFDWSGTEFDKKNSPNKPVQQGSALGTFSRGVVPGVVDPLINLGKLLSGNDSKYKIEDSLPSWAVNTEAEKNSSPIANFLGSAVGYAVPGFGEEKALTSLIPKLAQLKDLSKASKLAKLSHLTTHGAIQGLAYGEPGNRLQSTAGGALAGGLLGGLNAAAKTAPEAYNFAKNVINPKHFDKAIENASQDLSNTQELTDSSKSQLDKLAAHTPTTDPEKAQIRFDNTRAKISSLENDLNNAEELTPEGYLSKLFKGENPTDKLKQAQDVSDKAKEEEQIAKNSMMDHLGSTEDHDPKLRKKIIEGRNAIAAPLRENYAQVKFENGDLKGELPSKFEDNDGKEFLTGLRDSLDPESDDYEEFHKSLSDAIDNKTKEIPLNKMIDLWRATRSRASELKRQSVNPDFLAHEQQSARTAYQKILPMQNQLYSELKDKMDPSTFNLLNKTDEAWGSKVKPFDISPIYRAAKQGKQLPNDIIDKVSGDEPQNATMRQLLLNDPEMSRMALGKYYSSNPEKLLEGQESAEPFIRANPMTAHLREQYFDAKGNSEGAKNILDRAKQVYPQQAKALETKQNQMQEIQDLKDKLQKETLAHDEYQKQLAIHQRNATTLKEKQRILNQSEKAKQDFINTKQKLTNGIAFKVAKYGLYGAATGIAYHLFK